MCYLHSGECQHLTLAVMAVLLSISLSLWSLSSKAGPRAEHGVSEDPHVPCAGRRDGGRAAGANRLRHPHPHGQSGAAAGGRAGPGAAALRAGVRRGLQRACPRHTRVTASPSWAPATGWAWLKPPGCY